MERQREKIVEETRRLKRGTLELHADRTVSLPGVPWNAEETRSDQGL